MNVKKSVEDLKNCFSALLGICLNLPLFVFKIYQQKMDGCAGLCLQDCVSVRKCGGH